VQRVRPDADPVDHHDGSIVTVTAPARTPPVAERRASASIEVLDGGPHTTVQDLPGRIGYWHVGVPPSGPMDDLSHRLANRVVGNDAGAAALEVTGRGPALRFADPAVIAVVGAPMPFTVDRRPGRAGTPIALPAGAEVVFGGVDGPGLRVAVAVRGGIDEPFELGSRSTFVLGALGGHEGRVLAAGDVLAVGNEATGRPAPLAAGAAPALGRDWQVGVLVGPHTAPEFLTPEGLAALLATEWRVHFNSARTGVRLVGPRPRWARTDGGDAGLHPSNIHDTGYAIGAVDLTGDQPVILGPDGPSLGGFVCPAVVAAGERWKLGQLSPDDTVRLVPLSAGRAAETDRTRRWWLARATDPVEPVARPSWNASLLRRAPVDDAVLAQDPPTDSRPPVTYRRAGDRFVLVEFGEMTLDLELRLRVHALDRWVGEHLRDGLVDATAGVRSLLVQVDGDRLTTDRALAALRRGNAELADLGDETFASRIVHLPLSWDDPSTREAIARYMHGVRPDAPWCPWNIEFIRRINGLERVEDVHRIVFDASYLVLGLGDVYLGAPVATPLDPRHRLVTTKYNPARTWTPENAVGIGGAYLCIYGMEGPGGYQFVGRTVPVWNRRRLGPHFSEPWLLRPFDQIRWIPVDAAELGELRAAQAAGELPLRIEHSTFRWSEYQRFLIEGAAGIEVFRSRQQTAFAAERRAWEEAGEFEGVEP
jgi:urea carboxylase